MIATSTTTIELEEIGLPAQPAPAEHPDSRVGREWGIDKRSEPNRLGESEHRDPSPTPAARAPEKWNEPRRNLYRLGAAFWCFFVMGANDAVYGALIPYLESYYNLTYLVVSLVFLSPFVGYVSSAILNNHLHHKLGQRGIGILCGSCHLAAYVIIAAHPPYVALVFAFTLAGFGNGVADAAWNAWVGNLANSSELLGFLHALYGAGGVVSPLIATTLVTRANLEWYSVYYIMIGFAAVELISLALAFWDSNGATYRRESSESWEGSESGLCNTLFRMPAARVTWVAALFLLCYVGVEVALGGWIVTFMLRERHAGAFASGMSAVGFWLGITVGRAVLGFVTPRLGVKMSTASYMGAVMALELIFWLVPQFYVSAVAVSLQGFFLGPMFPNAVLHNHPVFESFNPSS
ncbi:major facilitator superfamily protein [Hirsutella rhossiliensis]|uniref:Major facilitator superfamily domain-containing protein n=1 Tax=Hirsutella rhossiliensis TaxID=111463 RepID=A0A9P8SMZ6_9HYPO|nr:major facilitator superfamily domain-containing protein [Hirsutella rhossiliensis]KAH0967370.1 major facilitator superfamily domain-containing protein [Hirsutella rhossiliensis]